MQYKKTIALLVTALSMTTAMATPLSDAQNTKAVVQNNLNDVSQ